MRITANYPKHWDSEGQEFKIAYSNYKMMADQIDAYPSLEEAVDAYHQNTIDSAKEEGMSPDQIVDCSCTYFSLCRHNNLEV